MLQKVNAMIKLLKVLSKLNTIILNLIHAEILPVFKAYIANDEHKRKEATEEYVVNTLDPLILLLEKQLAKNGTKFLVGSQV